MSPLVVDTDVASYIFKWHASAQHYADALSGSELILSFMSVAEMRMGALAAGWESDAEAFWNVSLKVSASFMPMTRCAPVGRRFALTLGRQAGR